MNDSGWQTPFQERELTARDVPDALFPTDNEWGVPVLDPTLQADAADLPINVWGAKGRRKRLEGGTLHFYTDDNRFEGLWQNPAPVVNARPITIVEPNFSTNLQMPRALALWHTYRKRWMARWWQGYGIRVFVDLDVHPDLQAINLLGVPHGWRSYACYMRQSDHRLEEIDAFLATAQERAGTDSVLLLVVGGGAAAQERCRALWQCVWVPSFDQAFYRNYNQKTQGGDRG